jgi:hypothetical protein
MMDNFYRFNFFSFLKWVMVLIAAVTGYKTSKNTEFVSCKQNFRPAKKAFRLILLASVFGLVQMHFMHQFRRDMKAHKKQHKKGVSPY